MSRRRPVTVSVRVRILAAMLIVAAAGMAIAGGSAFLVQRERVLSQVDQRLNDTATRLRSIATEKQYSSVRGLLTAAIQQITPDTNEGILGIIDGKSAVVPGSVVGVPLEKDRALISRVNRETRAGGVVLGTDVGSRGALRYLAVPVLQALPAPARGDAHGGVGQCAQVIGDLFFKALTTGFAAYRGNATKGPPGSGARD